MSVSRPCRVRRMLRARNAAPPTAVSRNANGIGDSASGHFQPPTWKAVAPVSHQPYVRPSMSPNASDANVMPDSTAPGTSIRLRPGERDSSTNASRPMTMSTAIGTLIPNDQRQEKSVVSQPPRSGPNATMPPIVDPQIAKAIPRSRPLKVALMRDSVVGRIIAPPKPCTTRARMSSAAVGASAAPRDASVKTTTPMSSMRRRPMRSAIVPQMSRVAAKTSVYDSCTHCTSVEVRPMSRSM